jgi:sulfide:quinone oxidoreductase
VYRPLMVVVIVGGGVAGLEALLGLRAMAGDRVQLTLAAPEPDFS